MAHFSKVFEFSTDLESWAYTAIGNATGGRALTGGNPGAHIYYDNAGRNKVDTESYWQWSGTFEDLGLDAGSTITGYSSSSYDWRCLTYLTVDVLDTGIMTLNDGTDRALAPSSSPSSASATYFTNSQSGTVTGLSLASTTSITITIPVNADNGNSSSANGVVDYDNITIGVDYTEAGDFVPAWAGGNIGRLL